MNINDVIKELEKKVSLDRFTPIEKLVWGILMAIVLSITGAVMTAILK